MKQGLRNYPRYSGENINTFRFRVQGKRAVGVLELRNLYNNSNAMGKSLVVGYYRGYLGWKKALVVPDEDRDEQLFKDAFTRKLKKKGIDTRIDEFLFLN